MSQALLPFGCQRWALGRDSYRPPAETIRPSEYEVGEIADDATPKAFVLEHHYSGSYPAARWRHGLYRAGRLVGVAVWSQPWNTRALTRALPAAPSDLTELGRFVLLDEVPANGETWFLGRAFAILRRLGLRGVVSHSDPVPRTAASGSLVFPGHLGTIYQAHNAAYLGRATARTLHLLPSGAVLSEDAIGKIRLRKRGWRYGVAQLVAAGAPEPGEDLRAWLRSVLGRVTRRLRHPGNYRYAWALDRHLRGALVEGRRAAYPKAGSPSHQVHQVHLRGAATLSLTGGPACT